MEMADTDGLIEGTARGTGEKKGGDA
jgi:hypothetical protein